MPSAQSRVVQKWNKYSSQVKCTTCHICSTEAEVILTDMAVKIKQNK